MLFCTQLLFSDFLEMPTACALTEGKVIHGWTIAAELGRGGFGAVYAVYKGSSWGAIKIEERNCAIKKTADRKNKPKKKVRAERNRKLAKILNTQLLRRTMKCCAWTYGCCSTT